MPPAGGVNIQIAASGEVPSPAAHGLVSALPVAQSSRRRADVHEQAAGAVEDEMLERMGVARRPSCRRRASASAPGRPCRIVSTVAAGCAASGSKRKILSAAPDVDAAVRADAEPVRQVELAQQHRDALALRRVADRAAAARPASGSQPPMSATTKKRVSGTCTIRARKDQPVLLAGDEAGAVAGTHRNGSLGKRAAGLRPERVAAQSGYRLRGRARYRRRHRQQRQHKTERPAPRAHHATIAKLTAGASAARPCECACPRARASHSAKPRGANTMMVEPCSNQPISSPLRERRVAARSTFGPR